MTKIKRVYQPPQETDGLRVLVDRLWPRGLGREKAKIDLWLKDIAPPDSLRKWFGHDPTKWKEFKRRYFRELKSKTELIKTMRDKMKKGTVTLVYGAKDTKNNNAAVLKEYLNKNR